MRDQAYQVSNKDVNFFESGNSQNTKAHFQIEDLCAELKNVFQEELLPSVPHRSVARQNLQPITDLTKTKTHNFLITHGEENGALNRVTSPNRIYIRVQKK